MMHLSVRAQTKENQYKVDEAPYPPRNYKYNDPGQT